MSDVDVEREWGSEDKGGDWEQASAKIMDPESPDPAASNQDDDPTIHPSMSVTTYTA